MKIGLVGASCCGKTTLFNALCKKFSSMDSINEIASNFTKEQREDFSFQKQIMYTQILYEKELSTFISDRTVIDNLAYCMWYDKFYNYEKKDIFNDVIKMFHAHMSSKPYDLVVFINEYFLLEDNGVRKMDELQQEDIFKYLNSLIPLMCEHYGIKYINVYGSTEKRLAQIKYFFDHLETNH